MYAESRREQLIWVMVLLLCHHRHRGVTNMAGPVHEPTWQPPCAQCSTLELTNMAAPIAQACGFNADKRPCLGSFVVFGHVRSCIRFSGLCRTGSICLPLDNLFPNTRTQRLKLQLFGQKPEQHHFRPSAAFWSYVRAVVRAGPPPPPKPHDMITDGY